MDALEAKTCENRRFWGRFQKNLVVWKLGDIKMEEEPSGQFQKNLVVWKLNDRNLKGISISAFQKNLVVWKLDIFRFLLAYTPYVSEELSSVETYLGRCSL